MARMSQKVLTIPKPNNIRNREVLLLDGTGCRHHDDCFTCPRPDCEWWLRKNRDTKYLRDVVRPLEKIKRAVFAGEIS